MTRREKILLLLFALLTAILCHFAFSPYGFNPTDEGFVLSSSVRLLHGQIPHVDFSSLRPMGYGYLHIPELLISREHTFLISRFVFWLEMSMVAYLWVLIINDRHFDRSEKSAQTQQISQSPPLGGSFKMTRPVILFIISFIFNTHYFPIAVLHTIDGLLLALIGFYILISTDKLPWLAGLFIGFAVICKQGFAVLIPLVFFLFPQKRSALLTALIPGIVYVVYISFHGGWNDMITQLTAHSEILEVGILNYILNPFLYAGILTAALIRKTKWAPLLSLLLIPYALLLLTTSHYHGKALLLIFGFVLADVYYEKEDRPVYLLALVLAWCVSISVGYASIALFSGSLLSLVVWRYFERSGKIVSITAVSILLVCIAAFIFIRCTHIYRDASRDKLNFKLDNLFYGATGIYTNEQTFSVLKELDSLRQAIPQILVLPDFTATQLFDYDRPVRTEWPNRAEVPNERILQKIIAPLDIDTNYSIAIAKYQTALLADSLSTTDHNDYRVVQYIATRYDLVDSSRYFQIYRHK